MNLVVKYLEQKGLTPRSNGKPINWNRLIRLEYNTQIDRLSCFYEEFAHYRQGIRSITITLEFDVWHGDPIKEFEGILEPFHNKLDFVHSGNHITLEDVRLIKYDVDNQFDCRSSRLIVELIAGNIIINSNKAGGI